MKGKLHHALGPAIVVVLFLVAAWVLHHALGGQRYHEVVAQIKGLPPQRILLALLLTALSYFALTGYDSLAFRYIRHPLPYPKIAVAAFIGYAFSNNIGNTMITGTSVRYRLYSAWGLSTVEIAKVVSFCMVTFWLGVFATSGCVLTLDPARIIPWLHWPPWVMRLVGLILLGVVGFYLVWSILRKHPLMIRDWEFPVPPFWLSLCQIVVTCVDLVLAGTVLYVLLPADPELSYPAFVSIYMVAVVLGLVSHVPGGLGVFEGVFLHLMPAGMAPPTVIGCLLVYRGVYYLLPLGVAALLLGVHELVLRKEAVSRLARFFGQWVPGMVPNALALTTFVGGAILLFSGATPGVGWRMAWLRDFLPLPVLEVSHFLGSIVGVGLLLLAHGLQRRIDAAYLLSIVLLLFGILVSLLKGFDYEEAIALTIMLTALLPSRGYFYRRASLLSERFTVGWVAGIAVVLVCTVWLGLFSHKHVEYRHWEWWSFTLSAEVPRFLRATVGALIVALLVATARLLRPARKPIIAATATAWDEVRAIVAESPDTSAHLALLGDKTFLFSESGKAFIMYGVEGRSWVAMGDPVGPVGERADLIWQFRELSDEHDGWPVFYQVETADLSLYLDLGLTLLKIGEEARVPLEAFSLEGGSRKNLRRWQRRLEEDEYRFEVVPASAVPALLPELRAVSDAWLADKHTREKRFSLGLFDERYLSQCPAALVRLHGRLIAFANLWLGAGRGEFSIDLMRHLPTAPPALMDYLFVHLLLWGQAEGYAWFNLGMAPLSGLEDRALAPLWHRLGAMIFRHGEHFYNFQGLRQYKEKFDPEWRPMYLASPGGLALPRVLANIAALVSGGLKGVVTK